MVAAGITDSNPLQQQQPSSSSSAVSVEDEALKRNTDCVYFLASPLTCKKGSECEYRHSEYARVNPRDCYYWLNGSCLNPKCAFRHPPLDGLLGTQVTASGGPSMPPSYPASLPVAHASYNHGKQAVPCIFFQKGFCVKGDKCAFLHGPNPLGSKVLQAPPIVPSTEPPAFKKPMVGLQKCNQEPKPPQLNMLKSNKATPDFKIAAISENAQVKNAMGSEPLRVNDESWRSANFTPAANGKIIARSNRTHQAEVSDDLSLQNGLDADDYHRESSPGFDVIVDDETGQSEYYHDDEQYGRAVHDGRKGMNEFDMDHSTEYDRVAGGDHEMVHDSRGYYSHKQMAGQYAWEEHRGSAHSERRRSRNSGSPENESDLRHHLAKQRKGNGLRSVINHEFARDNHNDGRRYHDSHRDSRHTASHDSSLSNRLGDRLKAPRRSPPLIGTDLPSRRDMDSGRSFGRLSPGRPPYSSHQGRFQDRIRGRVQEDSANQERGFRGQRIGRDGLGDFNVNFAGPKSLAELKGSKNSKVKEQLMMVKESFSLGKRKNTDMDGHQQSEGDVSFEGPKPLSEILKRKRGETSSVRSEASTGNISENNQNENKDNSGNQEDLHAIGSSSEIKPAGNTEEGQSSQVPDSTNKFETEDGMNLEEGEEYPEGYEEGEEYYYEQDEEGEYNLEEGENVYGDEEYPEEEEGAESGDKMGVVYS